MYRSPLDPYPRPPRAPPTWRTMLIAGALALALPLLVWVAETLPW